MVSIVKEYIQLGEMEGEMVEVLVEQLEDCYLLLELCPAQAYKFLDEYFSVLEYT